MRHKYSTQAIVLGRTALSETSALVTLLTPQFGLIRARAQGLRKPGAKLANALQTFSECEVMLVRGKEGWRLSGALLVENLFAPLSPSMRERAGRVASLILRLVRGEIADTEIFEAFRGFLRVLPSLSEESQDAAECLVALRVVHALGLDDGEVPDDEGAYAPPSLALIRRDRKSVVGRVNRGLSASGL